MYRFEYHAPTSIDAALEALNNSADGKIVAGGMTLLPTMKLRLAQPSDLIDLNGIGGLADISMTGDELVIGALTRHAAVAESDCVANNIPALAALAECIGDPQVRNRGTIGGSIANNDPAADYPAGALALKATVVTNKREIGADDFFTDMFETALAEDELITSVRFAVPKRAAYSKFPNPASRYAIVGVMVAEFGDEVRVAVTGAGPCVFRVAAMEAALASEFSSAAIESITIDADGLNEDLHASSEYRAHLVNVMARRAVAAAGTRT
jgi:carbon-monoxide dehydrogenase medium subunit